MKKGTDSMTTQAAIQDPVRFLELYRKIEHLDPLKAARLDGYLDGLTYENNSSTKGGCNDGTKSK